MTQLQSDPHRFLKLQFQRTRLFAQVGVELVDDFRGESPRGPVNVELDVEEMVGGNASWKRTEIRPVSKGATFFYPQLGRRREVESPDLPGQRLITRYRVRVISRLYRPLYDAGTSGIEFEVVAFNDEAPLPDQHILSRPQRVFLFPSSNYPFESHINVVRGQVFDAQGAAAIDAIVQFGEAERVLTDRRGSFALPVRWLAASTTTTEASAVNPDTLVVKHQVGMSGFARVGVVMNDQVFARDIIDFNRNGNTATLTLDPPLPGVVPPDTSLRLLEFELVVTPSAGPSQTFPIDYATAFTSNQPLNL